MRLSTWGSCAARPARPRSPGLVYALWTPLPSRASRCPARSCATTSSPRLLRTLVPSRSPSTAHSETPGQPLRSSWDSSNCSQGQAPPTWRTSSLSPIRRPRAAPQRRPSSRTCRPPRGCITSSIRRVTRSTWDRPRPCARAWAATTRRRRSGRRCSVWCPSLPVCGPIPRRPSSRRESENCAISGNSHRPTIRHRRVRDPSTGSSPMQAVLASYRPCRSTICHAPSAPSARERTPCGQPEQSNAF